MQIENLPKQQRLNRRQFLAFGVASLTALAFGGILAKPSQAAALSQLEANQSASITPNTSVPQAAVALAGITHTWQTLNNCGPAILAMNLSYYGETLDQQTIAQTLRPTQNDQNVRPDELAGYALAQGYAATLRVNGNADQLRLLLNNGIPVIIETWESDDLTNVDDGFAHFRLVTGYNDTRQAWIVYDSYFARDLVNARGAYAGMYVPYAQADQLWRIMNRKYVVIYPTAKASLVESLLADVLDDENMWQNAINQAQTELTEQPNDRFAWFNLGSSLYGAGQPTEAVAAFRQAQSLGLPKRMFWYQYDPLEAYYADGHYTELISLIDANLATATGIKEFYYWKALALVALGNAEQAHQAIQQVLAIKPDDQQALAVLEQGLLS